MNIANYAKVALVAVALCIGASAQAAVLTFNGNASALATGFGDPSCAPSVFRQSAIGTGTSSLGSFDYTHTTCVTPGGPVSGIFAFKFADDTFAGTLIGTNSPTGTPGIFSPDFTYAILSGTGRFLDATGTLLGSGSIDARVAPTKLSFVFDGSINAPAVPEPSTWSMLLVGFGLVGWSLRHRRAEVRLPTAA